MFKLDHSFQPATAVSSAAEQELSVALAIPQAMLAAAADGIVVTDEHGQITAVTPRFVEMWGVPPDLLAFADFSARAAWGARQCREPAVGAVGLAAVLGIVGRYQGAIRIDSALGEGTTFRVLPPTSRADCPAPTAPTPPPVSHGARVLVVDDEQPVLRVASEMLRRAGYTVATAGSGEQALALASQPGVAFDVVLMDMTMPTMNGAETSKRLRLLHPGLPIVLMSGYTSEEAVSRFGDGRLSGFVQKPFMPAALVRTIADALAGRDDSGGSAGNGELA